MALGSPRDAANHPRWAGLLAGATLAISAAALAIARTFPIGDTPHGQIFHFLFTRDEAPAAWLALAIALGCIAFASFFATRGQVFAGRMIGSLNEDPRAFILAATIAMGAAAVAVYRGHPLSMDEYSPVFQAGAFARGHLTGQIPPELLPRLIPRHPWFLMSSPTGQMISMYWPGFALLLTPFWKLGCPWLLNPLIGGLTLFALWHLARKLWPDSQAAGWTVLLAAASPALTINAISFYTMPAHLLASVVFALLLLDPAPKRLFLAGLLGSFALVLHNPLPHTLFALPWMAWLALRPGRVKNLAILAAGYLPLTILLGAGWLYLQKSLQIANIDSNAAFALPSFAVLLTRAMNFVELGLWAVPFLLPLAAVAAVLLFRETFPRLLLFSALLTLLGYFFVPFDQGHGWGYRYFHSAWLVLPLFGGAILAKSEQGWLRGLLLPAALLSLILGTGLRCYQVRTFIDGQLFQIPSRPNPDAQFEVVFVRADAGFYTVDLVQDDPFLDNDRWMLLSEGGAADTRLMQEKFKGSYLVTHNAFASVWRVNPAAP